MTETTETRTRAAAKGGEATPQQGKRSKAAPAQQIKLTPAVEAALAKAAAELPLSPSEIVDTALRDWLRVWYPDLL